jgi:hypothetical protein
MLNDSRELGLAKRGGLQTLPRIHNLATSAASSARRAAHSVPSMTTKIVAPARVAIACWDGFEIESIAVDRPHARAVELFA